MKCRKYDYGTLSKLYARLVFSCRCALADLEGIMPELEPSGDREHPGWQTVKELQDTLSPLASGQGALNIVDLYENALGKVGAGMYYWSDRKEIYLGEIVDVRMVNIDTRQIVFVLDTGASIEHIGVGDSQKDTKFYTGVPK